MRKGVAGGFGIVALAPGPERFGLTRPGYPNHPRVSSRWHPFARHPVGVIPDCPVLPGKSNAGIFHLFSGSLT